MYAHMALLAVLGVAITVGYRTRLAAGLFAVGFVYVELIDAGLYLNHYWFVTLAAVTLAIVPPPARRHGPGDHGVGAARADRRRLRLRRDRQAEPRLVVRSAADAPVARGAAPTVPWSARWLDEPVVGVRCSAGPARCST